MGRALAHARRLRTAALVLGAAGVIMVGSSTAMTVLVASDESAPSVLLGAVIVSGVLGLVVVVIAVGLVVLARDVAAAPRVDPMPWGSRTPSEPNGEATSDGSAATWALIESMRADHHPPQ